MTDRAQNRDLQSAGHDLIFPFDVRIRIQQRTWTVQCHRLMRLVPGRRLVCLAEWNRNPVVLKLFLDRIRGRRHQRREAVGMQALKQARIPTPELVFEGEIRPGNIPVLGYEHIDPAMGLVQALQESEGEPQRIEILKKAVGLVAGQHEAGLLQTDLHRDNFLWTGERVLAIDGASVDSGHAGVALPQKKSLANLAFFFTHLYPRQTETVAEVFRAYCRHRGWPERTDTTRRLLRQVGRCKNRRQHVLLKKLYRETSAWSYRKSWRRVMVCRRSYLSPALEVFFTDPDRVMAAGRTLKRGNSCTVVRIDVDETALVVKRYNIKHFRHALKRCLRPSRAWRSWRNANLLRFHAIDTPEPVGFLELRWGPFRGKAYFLARYEAGQNLERALDADAPTPADPVCVVSRITDLLKHMQQARLSHGDFKATNFILSGDRLLLLDLDAMRQHRFVWRLRRALRRDWRRWMRNWRERPDLVRVFEAHQADMD